MKSNKAGGNGSSFRILERGYERDPFFYFENFEIKTYNILTAYSILIKHYMFDNRNTKDKVDEIVNWYLENKGMEMVKLAASFYHLFITVKPFLKENQYMAQVLLNTILVGHGLPPVVIPLERRLEFLTYKEVPSVFDIESIIRGQLDNSGRKKTYLKIL